MSQNTTNSWEGFKSGEWSENIDLHNFIQLNYTPYVGDAMFLANVTDRTKKVWAKLEAMFPEEIERGVYSIDATTPSLINSHQPGYIDKDNEIIVGLQTDAPLKRAIMPFGGWRMVETALETYGYPVDPEIKKTFTEYRKTHNAGVFDAYTSRIRGARTSHLITGLPDSYGRGRIIGDYRRVALYGIDFLIAKKMEDKKSLDEEWSTEDIIRDREETSEQIRALKELKAMAAGYGYDISKPAATAKEAVQWLYFGYLAAVKEQNGAAMSLGRTSTFLDIYFARDIAAGILTENQAQEIVDDFVIKLRIVRFLRTPEYDEIFAGDPTWVTETIGGIGQDDRPLVTKTSFRFLQTLYNLGAAPEPNLTVLWSDKLPTGFKKFCAQVSIDTSAIQYESNEEITKAWGDDAAIACCVSPMAVGKQMQFFGARVNLGKALLYSLNGGRDENSGAQVATGIPELKNREVLDYDEVWELLDTMMTWLAGTYVEALDIIHYMHDKYAYERIEMALHDKEILRTLACGIAGLSVVADSLSAIKYGTVKPIYDDRGLITDFDTTGDYPFYGNDDDRVDSIAIRIADTFMDKIRLYPTYRGAKHTMSILTITSNVVYGKVTGTLPSRVSHIAGEPFAPGANPSNGVDERGMLASMLSVAKLRYENAQDGISLTNTIVPTGLGRTKEEQVENLSGLLDAGFMSGLYHANINVLNKETLLDAFDHPELYPNLTIRVSGYAVHFARLTKEQQMDVISRTFHGSV